MFHTSRVPTTLTAQRAAAEVRAEVARQRKPQREIADILGMSQAAASRRLLGQVEFSLSELTRLAEVLGVPLSAFIRDDAEQAVSA